MVYSTMQQKSSSNQSHQNKLDCLSIAVS